MNIKQPNIKHASLEEVDSAIEDRFTTVNNSIKKHSPHNTLPSPTLSHTTKIIIALFNAIRNQSNTHGWSYQQYKLYNDLQKIPQETLVSDKNEK